MSLRTAVREARSQLVSAGEGKLPALAVIDTYVQQTGYADLTLGDSFADVFPVEPGAVLSAIDPKHTQHLSLIHISEPTRPY